MMKLLALLLVDAPVVVLGRGTNDGASAPNAYEIELLPGLKLFTFNQINFNNSTDELHGDLVFETTSVLGQYNLNVEYGYCIRPSAEGSGIPSTTWDCLSARTGVDPS